MNDKHRILSTVGIYHAFNDGSVAVIPLLFPIFKVLFNLSYTQIGVITGGGLLIILIAQIFIGRISDRKNFRTLLSIGILLLSGSLLLLTQTQGFLTLLLFIFIVRLSSSFFHPIGIGWVSRVFKKDRLDWAMGIQSALGDLGAFIAILTALYIAEIKGWDFPFYLWTITGIGVLFLGLFLTQNIHKEYITVTNTNNKKQTLNEAVFEAWDMLKRVKLLIPAFIISGAAWGITISYLPLLLDERTTLSLSAIGIIISIWMGMGVIVCFSYGRIQSYLGRRNTLIFAYLIMGIMGFALSIFTNIIIILFIMVLLGISTFVTFPAMFSFVSEKTHESMEGKTFGYVLTIQLGGGTVLLFLSGVFSDIWGIWIPFTILGFLCFFVAFVLIGNRKKDVVLK